MFFTWAMRPALVCPAPSGPWQEAQFLVQLSLASAENAGVAPSMKTAAAHAGIVILFIGVVSLPGAIGAVAGGAVLSPVVLGVGGKRRGGAEHENSGGARGNRDLVHRCCIFGRSG